jgi:predicted GNAT family acetyltransferase
MAINSDAVIATCHTPVRSARGAEAAVWTHPVHRGQGRAAAVSAAWAALIRPTGRYLFYSTWAENRSSMRVAARLGLRPIGWMWKIAPP